MTSSKSKSKRRTKRQNARPRQKTVPSNGHRHSIRTTNSDNELLLLRSDFPDGRTSSGSSSSSSSNGGGNGGNGNGNGSHNRKSTDPDSVRKMPSLMSLTQVPTATTPNVRVMSPDITKSGFPSTNGNLKPLHEFNYNNGNGNGSGSKKKRRRSKQHQQRQQKKQHQQQQQHQQPQQQQQQQQKRQQKKFVPKRMPKRALPTPNKPLPSLPAAPPSSSSTSTKKNNFKQTPQSRPYMSSTVTTTTTKTATGTMLPNPTNTNRNRLVSADYVYGATVIDESSFTPRKSVGSLKRKQKRSSKQPHSPMTMTTITTTTRTTTTTTSTSPHPRSANGKGRNGFRQPLPNSPSPVYNRQKSAEDPELLHRSKKLTFAKASRLATANTIKHNNRNHHNSTNKQSPFQHQRHRSRTLPNNQPPNGIRYDTVQGLCTCAVCSLSLWLRCSAVTQRIAQKKCALAM